MMDTPYAKTPPIENTTVTVAEVINSFAKENYGRASAEPIPEPDLFELIANLTLVVVGLRRRIEELEENQP